MCHNTGISDHRTKSMEIGQVSCTSDEPNNAFSPPLITEFEGKPRYGKPGKTQHHNQMKEPYFPITMDIMQARIVYHQLKEKEVEIGPAKVIWRQMQHPGKSYSYKVSAGEGSFIFATDTELRPEDFERTPENRNFFLQSDVLAIDSQYTLDEAIEKYDWGHSSYSLAVDFASEWKIKNLVLFHHEPLYNDNKMQSITKSAGWYMSHVGKEKLKIYLAQEGLELTI